MQNPRILALAALTLTSVPASPVQFHDIGAAWTNVSPAGTINASAVLAFDRSPTPLGLPFAISSQSVTGWSSVGTVIGSTLIFDFSPGYLWGVGGQLIIGNVHNGYEYTLRAFDENGVAVDTSTWLQIGPEYPSTSPGTTGYFSTSSTTVTRSGFDTIFSVVDPNVDANMGQGGIIHLGGLQNVSRLTLELTSSTLVPNFQGADLILFNVATPVPEPATAFLAGVVLLCVGLRGRRTR